MPFQGRAFVFSDSLDLRGRTIWSTNGDSADVQFALDPEPAASGREPWGVADVYGGALYFDANRNEGSGRELWRWTVSIACS